MLQPVNSSPSPHKAGEAVVPPPAERQWAMGAEAFHNVMPHHAGIEALWETKWKFPCTRALYPFHDGALEDFEPVFRDLVARTVDDGTSPEYTRAFLPAAAALERRGDDAARAGDAAAASALYLRAACVLRIARFPYVGSRPRVTDPVKWDAWERQKKVYMKAARTWDAPVAEVLIPHTFGQGADGDTIPAYVRVPPADAAEQQKQHPVVLLLTGLDGYRPDNTTRCDEFLARGWASVVVEIPGTADCPADPADPAAGDRLWDSVLAWVAADGRLDAGRVVAWGLSAGGYHAVRAAHTHRGRLRGVVAQGAGVHHFFDRDWLARADGHEYPFRLAPAMAAKHGYAAVDEYREGVQKKFSLLELGIIQQPSTRLLLINVSLTTRATEIYIYVCACACVRVCVCTYVHM